MSFLLLFMPFWPTLGPIKTPKYHSGRCRFENWWYRDTSLLNMGVNFEVWEELCPFPIGMTAIWGTDLLTGPMRVDQGFPLFSQTSEVYLFVRNFGVPQLQKILVCYRSVKEEHRSTPERTLSFMFHLLSCFLITVTFALHSVLTLDQAPTFKFESYPCIAMVRDANPHELKWCIVSNILSRRLNKDNWRQNYHSFELNFW